MAQAQFTNAAKAEFAGANNADAWVIAFAMMVGATVVTPRACRCQCAAPCTHSERV